MKSVNYTLELPSPEQIRTLWMDVYDASKPRLEIVSELRDVINGKNSIPMPEAVGYKAIAEHAFLLRNATNAKASRFRHFPEFQVAAEYNARGNITPTAEKQATKIERWDSRFNEMAEQASSGWQRIVEDAISYYVAAERIECAPASDWKDVIDLDVMKEEGVYPFEDAKWKYDREARKRAAGVPIRTVHVPSDSIFWVREGNTTTEVFEVEQRNLRSVLRNPLFQKSEFVTNRQGNEVRLSDKVTILHYNNHNYHAYYALTPSESGNRFGSVPSGGKLAEDAKGQPILLHHYETGIGRVIYNIVWGPYGPWDGNVDPMLGRLASLRDLSYDADKYKSYLATAVRRLGLPTYQQTFDPDSPRDMSDSRPKPIEVKEGGIIALWKNEQISMLPNSFDIGALRYAYEDTEQKFHAIAGVQSQYGIHQEGAATGYHEAMLLQQSQSTERLQEIGLKHGAENRMDIVHRYIKFKIKEPVPIVHSEVQRGQTKKMAFQYVEIGPDDLDPMPIVTASVIAPSPQDFTKNLANMYQALTPVPGTNRPLTDRTTALTRIGNFENADEIERNIDIELMEAAALASPQYTNIIIRKMMSQLAMQESEIANQQQFLAADPAIMAGADMAMQTGEISQMGGISPDTAVGMANASGRQGVGGGLPEGMAQPMQVMGLTDLAMEGMA